MFVLAHDRVALHVRTAGPTDGTPVLLLHGQASSGRVWKDLMCGSLAEHARLIAPDYRGHGRSGMRQAGYRDTRTWAADVQTIVDHFALDRPVLVGWSYGSAVACDYLRAGGRARAFALIAGGPEADLRDRQIRSTLSPDVQALVRSRLRLSRRAFAERVVGLFTCGPIRSELRKVLVEDVIAVSTRAALSIVSRTYRNDDVLAAFAGPILQLHGAEDRVRLPYAAERRTSLFQDGATELWADSGHAPFLDEPGRFEESIAALLRRCGAG